MNLSAVHKVENLEHHKGVEYKSSMDGVLTIYLSVIAKQVESINNKH